MVLLLAAGSLAERVPAQAPGRIATTPQALVASPIFFHGKQIAVRAKPSFDGEITRLELPIAEAPAQKAPTRQIFVFWRERPTRGEGEIRGEFWDLGRLSEGDGRFSAYDFQSLLDRVTKDGRWPGRDEIFVILGGALHEASLPPDPTVRAIALAPESYENRTVTVPGRFRGRNLYGDLPGPVNKSRWDFVLHSADAAVWISGQRPKGRSFDLDAGTRADTGRWLSVTGTVRVEGHHVWIEASAIDLATAPAEAPVEIAVPVTPREPPPEVIFSAPVPDDVDVEVVTTVRIQFSRDMSGGTIRDRVRVTYAAPPGAEAPPAPEFTVSYDRGNRGVQIAFAKPLERFATVRVELLEGITAVDGQPLKPWTMTFTTGA